MHGRAVRPARQHGHVDIVFVEMSLACYFDIGCWIGLLVLPQFLAVAMFGHVGMAQLRHHGAEILNALDIVARQVGKEGFVVGRGVMHVAVDEAELGGRAAVCG